MSPPVVQLDPDSTPDQEWKVFKAQADSQPGCFEPSTPQQLHRRAAGRGGRRHGETGGVDASSRLFLPPSSFPPVHNGRMNAKACWDPKAQNHLVIQTGCADTSRMTVVTELQGLEGSFPPLYGMGTQKEGICSGLAQGLWREMAWVQTLLVAGRHRRNDLTSL